MKLYLLTAILGGLLLAVMVACSPLRTLATPWRLATWAYLFYGAVAGVAGAVWLGGVAA